MGGFSLDLSGLNPAINALFQRQMAGIDYRLGRMPKEAAQGDYAFQNFLRNDRQKRTQAKESFRSEQAAQSLQRRLAEEGMREARGAKYRDEAEKRAALQASLGANQRMASRYSAGYGFTPEATLRDFYTYGPWARGGRGGGGSADTGRGSGRAESDTDDFNRRSAEWQSKIWQPGLNRF